MIAAQLRRVASREEQDARGILSIAPPIEAGTLTEEQFLAAVASAYRFFAQLPHDRAGYEVVRQGTGW